MFISNVRNILSKTNNVFKKRKNAIKYPHFKDLSKITKYGNRSTVYDIGKLIIL